MAGTGVAPRLAATPLPLHLRQVVKRTITFKLTIILGTHAKKRAPKRSLFAVFRVR